MLKLSSTSLSIPTANLHFPIAPEKIPDTTKLYAHPEVPVRRGPLRAGVCVQVNRRKDPFR